MGGGNGEALLSEQERLAISITHTTLIINMAKSSMDHVNYFSYFSLDNITHHEKWGETNNNALYLYIIES